MMWAGESFNIRCRWNEAGEELLLLGDEPADRWQPAVFAWHERTWYGLLADIVSWKGEEAVRLDALTAIDYFAAPAPLLHCEIVWDREAEGAQAAAAALKEALAKGWYMPDAANWEPSAGSWKLHVPENESARIAALLGRAEELGVHYSAAWLNQAVRQCIEKDDGLRETWQRLRAAYPALGMSAADIARIGEEEWLIAAGFRKDTRLFTVALQLREPEEDGGSWMLAACLRDVADDMRTLSVAFDGKPLDGATVPADWEPHVVAELAKAAARWMASLPELASRPEFAALSVLPEQSALPAMEETAFAALPEVAATVQDGVPANYGETDEAFAWYFLTEGSLKLLAAGHPVMLPSWWEEASSARPRLRAMVRSSVGDSRVRTVTLSQLVEFNWRLALGGVEMSEEEFARLYESERRLALVRGRWVRLDPSDWERLRRLMQRYKMRGMTLGDALHLHLAGTAVDADEDTGNSGSEDAVAGTDDAGTGAGAVASGMISLEAVLDERLSECLAQLQRDARMPAIEPPSGLRGQLRGYQLEGASWLAFLGRLGLGGCLADDMGLGKTLQWIAYLLHRKEQGLLDGPALLVCPTSVLGNWQKELSRFAPELKVYIHHGSQRLRGEAFQAAVREADLTLSTYPLMHPDAIEFGAVEWNTVGLDEAQNIKNSLAKQTTAIRALRAGHRVALTGTPMENRLTELWSIFDFINPGYLGGLTRFKRRFVGPIERTGDPERMSRLRRLVRPFLLRRMKKDPAIQLDLPEKNEMKTYVPLTARQGVLYEQTVRDLLEKLDTLPAIERRALILAAMTRLKQICDHPSLVLPVGGGKGRMRAEESHKCNRLLEMIDEVRSEGESCLVFTQFVRMGRALQALIRGATGEPVDFLHGGVERKERDAMVERFQQPAGAARKTHIMVLSLKAGGTGLNLTAANHVFHFDRWWNPAVENQATDRAYRIGQTKDVQVHKFIALGTLEERIDEMIERKLSLAEHLVGGGEQWITELSTGELRDIFELRREWIEG